MVAHAASFVTEIIHFNQALAAGWCFEKSVCVHAPVHFQLPVHPCEQTFKYSFTE